MSRQSPLLAVMPHLRLHTNSPPSPTLFAIIPPSPIPALKSPSTCFSDDHYTGTSSPPSELQLFRFVIAANIDSTTGSLTSVVTSLGPSSNSPTSLQLFIDLSSYHFQQLPTSDFSPPRSATHSHPMVLCPWLLKIALLTTSAASSATPICWVMSSPTSESIAFSDADRYEA